MPLAYLRLCAEIDPPPRRYMSLAKAKNTFCLIHIESILSIYTLVYIYPGAFCQVVQRDTFANLFHDSEDFVNSFLAMAILRKAPADMQVFLTDLYPDGPFW